MPKWYCFVMSSGHPEGDRNDPQPLAETGVAAGEDVAPDSPLTDAQWNALLDDQPLPVGELTDDARARFAKTVDAGLDLEDPKTWEGIVRKPFVDDETES